MIMRISLLVAGLILTGISMVSVSSTVEEPMNISVQLWSVRHDLKKDFDGTLAKLAAMGFEGVEYAGNFGPYDDEPEKLKALHDSLGLECAGAHVNIKLLRGKKLEQSIAFFKTLDCPFLIVPMDSRADHKKKVYELAKELDAIALKLKPHGLLTGYHNHGTEMDDINGTTYWDMLAGATGDDVILQQDVGWTTSAGKDPVVFVRKYPGRTKSTHYKAMLPRGTKGKLPIIGQDTIDWVSLIKANREVGGTIWYTVEQEKYPNGMSPLESVEASLRGLEKIIEQMQEKVSTGE